MVNVEEAKINDIVVDNDDIDLTIGHDCSLHSTQRCYECDNAPCYNDRDDERKSYKCCKHHGAKLIKHGIRLKDITNFTCSSSSNEKHQCTRNNRSFKIY